MLFVVCCVLCVVRCLGVRCCVLVAHCCSCLFVDDCVLLVGCRLMFVVCAMLRVA